MNGATRGDTVIRKSTSKLLGATITGAVLVGIGVLIIKGGLVDSRGEHTVYLGWLISILSGLLLSIIIPRLLVGHRKPVELSPQGFWDRRVLKHKVPWNAVSRFSIVSVRGNSVLRIQLTDEAMQQNKLTQIGQVTKWLHEPFGLDGIFVSSMDLDISFSELRMLFQKYLTEYNPAVMDDAY